MITLEQAKTALELNGFKVSIDTETDGLVELHASKDGFSEIFFDTKETGCSSYLSAFADVERLVKYAEKSIELEEKYS